MAVRDVRPHCHAPKGSVAIGNAALTGPILAGARDLRGETFLKPKGTAEIGAYAFTSFQQTLLILR